MMRYYWIILFMVLLGGCSVFSPVKVTPVSTYTISDWPHHTINSKSTPKPKTKAILLMGAPIASPGYDSRRMIYVSIPYQLNHFANHAWIAPPAQLLLPLIAKQLRALHYFHAVVTTPFTGVADYLMNVQLINLQQEFLQPQSVVRLTVEVTLQSLRTSRIMGNHVFQVVVPVSENSPYGGVLATNEAAHELVGQIGRYVVYKAR